MRRLIPVRSLTFLSVTLLAAGVSQAQFSNPLLPSGVGSSRDIESYSSGSGSASGLGLGGRNRGERNPADVLLNEINGTNRGRRTGRAALQGTQRYRVRRVDLSSKLVDREDKQAVFFDRRGAYEDAIYSPQRGTYRSSARRPRATRSSAPRPRS